MNEKIKYASNRLFTLAGFAWLLVAMFNLAIIFIFTMDVYGFSPSMLVMPFIMGILSVVLGIHYLRITKRNYLVIDDNLISIDKGLIRKKKNISFKNIDTVKTIGNKLRIGLKEGSEERINLDLLTVEDINRLNSVLETNF